MRRVWLIVVGAAAAVALLFAVCSGSPSNALTKQLIAASTLEPAPWGLRVASGGRTFNALGLPPAGARFDTRSMASADAVATRQWLSRSGLRPSGPLPEGIFTVIDRVARFRSAAEAHTAATQLAAVYGTGATALPQRPGATLLTTRFAVPVPNGQLTGAEELVIIEHGNSMFTVLVVGGGSRPTAADAQALASLQAAAYK